MVESPSQDHRHSAGERPAPKIIIVTVSDTRTIETDASGTYLQQSILDQKWDLIDRQLVKDEPQQIQDILNEIAEIDCQVVIFNGGTGISQRDRTFDVLETKLEKLIPGFGELFRSVSYNEIGAAAMLTRAVAGLWKGKLIFSLPGSEHAVRTGWEKLIVPELEHMVWEMTR